jgi:hypothetical protein
MLGRQAKLGTRLDGVAGLSQCGEEISLTNFGTRVPFEPLNKLALSPPVSPLPDIAQDRYARARTWIILSAIAFAVRLAAAFLLPTAEQDGYSYAEIIAQLSAKLNAGHFRLADFYGFWLPLFQFAAAVLNVWIDNPLLAGKILSSLCGAVSCLLVFAITKKLTERFALACVAFIFVLCNPLHVLYSAASMTDVPAACLILASLWFVLQDRWLGAAIFAALAEGVRIEAWVLIVLLPLLQFARQRRMSPSLIGAVLLPPIIWLIICWLATRDPLSFLAERARYQASYLEFYPTRRGFTFADIAQDASYFLLGANRIVVLAIVAAWLLSILRAFRNRSAAVAIVSAYAGALFAFLFVAYITKRQPVLLPRYGLIFFTLGLPILMWLIGISIARYPRSWPVKLIAFVIIALCLRETKGQVLTISKVLADFRAHRRVADVVATTFAQSSDREQRCFSDDPAVRVLSRLPLDRFARSAFAPASAWGNRAAFESYLEQKQVGYLVFVRIEDSLPVRHFPQLGSRQSDVGKFQLITVAFSPFAPDVWLYRLRNE